MWILLTKQSIYRLLCVNIVVLNRRLSEVVMRPFSPLWVPSENLFFISTVIGETLPAVELKRDEWSHSGPGVSFRMGVEANDGSLNELFYYFLSTAAWLPIRNWIAPNGSHCGDGRALKRDRCSLEPFSWCMEIKLKNVMGTDTFTQMWLN